MTIRWLSRRSSPLLPEFGDRPAESQTSSSSADGTDSAENPYLNARRTWNDHVGTLVSARNTWQLIGAASLVVSLLAVGGVVYIGSQAKFIPYVVQVDKQGQTLAVGPIERAPQTDARLIHAALANFIADFRMVTPDVELQRKAIFRIYAHLRTSDPAASKMNEFMRAEETNPLSRAADSMVSTRIITVLPQTQETWQIDWEETTRDRAGNVQSAPALYRGLITVYVSPPVGQVDDDQLRKNPLGIYVRDFSFAPLPPLPTLTR